MVQPQMSKKDKSMESEKLNIYLNNMLALFIS